MFFLQHPRDGGGLVGVVRVDPRGVLLGFANGLGGIGLEAVGVDVEIVAGKGPVLGTAHPPGYPA